MARTVYYTATSLDGFIADADGSLDWLRAVPHAEDDDSWEEFIAGVGVLVMGATTYADAIADNELETRPEQWQEWYGDRPTWVFTHRRLPAVAGADIRFAEGDVPAAHREIVAAAGDRDVWLVGGGDLVGQYLDAGLLEEVVLSVVPAILTGGTPVLTRRLTSERLTVREVRQLGQRVRMSFTVNG
ncbi:dihydrofolate reductase family protein [Nocardioides speluncae]|uniref:dihydrofolate reductase family protein n=1 Tax=Nocardioides speluncae TaxID=2670337 RepID=UPI000D693300|nr:dihydrofolate reductase family protein [Nocardioides speluncae]